MVYVTGDMHGEFERFKAKELRKLKKEDTLIICGDFGFIWNGSKREQNTLKKIASLPYQIAFVDGCHENFDLLLSYPVNNWNGAPVHQIAKNIVHLQRGNVYTIEQHTYFAFGGGHSGDMEFREEGWWVQERPTKPEIQLGIKNLSMYGNQIDYVITHEPPSSLKDCLKMDIGERLEVNAFFEEMVKICLFRKWFFGKCHINKYIPVKFYAMFDDVLPVTVKNTDI
ncbi:MAG TPA: hypothetical protein DCO72_02030 [Ruminococcus sp.]|nr:hypothetical protein [Ruminococcus sp.]